MFVDHPPRAAPLQLAPFLRQERASILREWEAAEREALPLEGMSRKVLLDYIPHLLDDISDLAEREQGGESKGGLSEESSRAHARHRLEHEFSLEQVSREYALLRKVILCKLGPEGGGLDVDSLVLLNQCLDQAVTEAVVTYDRGSSQRLDEARRRLEAVLEFLPTAVIIAQAPEGGLVFGNRKVAEVLGHPFISLSDVSWYSQVQGYHPDRRPYAPAEHPLVRAFAGENVAQAEMVYLRKDGTWRYLHVSTAPIHDRQGQVTSAVMSMTDLTEMKRLEEERRALETQARQRADFERQLIGIVSHDLRNPLSAITLGAVTLLRRTDLDTRQRSVVTRILNSAERAHRMIRDLLDFTQARLGGGIPVSLRTLNVHELTRQVVDEVQLIHPERSFAVHAEGAGQGEWDGDRLAQVLTNLLNNAVQHSPADTEVSVRSSVTDTRMRLEVHNLGAPLPDELRERLFLPLERGMGKGVTDRADRSVGLGLYIVKSIVSAHQGHIEVRSSVAEGTTFIIDLPRHAVPPV